MGARRGGWFGLVGMILLGCNGGGGGPGGLRVRDTVRTVHVFDEVSVDCLVESGCPQYVAPTIVDVAREGDTIAVLYRAPRWNGASYTSNQGVAVSHDLGETWEHRSYHPTTSGVIAADAVGARALVVWQDELYTFLPWETEDGPLRPFTFAIDRVALDEEPFPGTAAAVPAGRVMATRLFEARTSRSGAGLYSHEWAGYSLVLGSEWVQWDPATGARLGGEFGTPAPEGLESCTWPRTVGTQRSSDGELALYGVCRRATTEPLVCANSAALPSAWFPTTSCVPAADWPVPAESVDSEITVMPRASHAGVLFVEPRGGAAFTRMARIRGGVAEAIDVGPGEPLLAVRDAGWDRDNPFRAEAIHPRFGDLVALVEPRPEESTHVTLYRTDPSGGFAATTLPTRACPDDQPCGFLPVDNSTGFLFPSTLQWALPLGDEEYLLFYVVDLRPDSTRLQNAMFVARERIDRGPPAMATQIEAACMREGGCIEENVFFDVEQCVRRWMSAERHISDAELAAFTAATSCEALAAADPLARLGTPCATEGSACDGDVGISCTSGFVFSVQDCGAIGGTCRTDPDRGILCDVPGCPEAARTCDAQGRAVYCETMGIDDCPARGLTCVNDPASGTFGCVAPAGVCEGLAPGASACEGDLLVSCVSGGALPFLDCGRVDGLTCEPERQCAGTDGCEPTLTPYCEGSHLRYCLYSSLRDVDCAAIGLGCSVDGVGRGRCL